MRFSFVFVAFLALSPLAFAQKPYLAPDAVCAVVLSKHALAEPTEAFLAEVVSLRQQAWMQVRRDYPNWYLAYENVPHESGDPTVSSALWATPAVHYAQQGKDWAIHPQRGTAMQLSDRLGRLHKRAMARVVRAQALPDEGLVEISREELAVLTKPDEKAAAEFNLRRDAAERRPRGVHEDEEKVAIGTGVVSWLLSMVPIGWAMGPIQEGPKMLGPMVVAAVVGIAAGALTYWYRTTRSVFFVRDGLGIPERVASSSFYYGGALLPDGRYVDVLTVGEKLYLYFWRAQAPVVAEAK